MKLFEVAGRFLVTVKGTMVVPLTVNAKEAVHDIRYGAITVGGQQLSAVDLHIVDVKKTQQGYIFTILLKGALTAQGDEQLERMPVTVAGQRLNVVSLVPRPFNTNRAQHWEPAQPVQNTPR